MYVVFFNFSKMVIELNKVYLFFVYLKYNFDGVFLYWKLFNFVFLSRSFYEKLFFRVENLKYGFLFI